MAIPIADLIIGATLCRVGYCIMLQIYTTNTNTHSSTHIQCKLIIIIYHCYSSPVELLQNCTISIKVLCYFWCHPEKPWILFRITKQWRDGIKRNLRRYGIK